MVSWSLSITGATDHQAQLPSPTIQVFFVLILPSASGRLEEGWFFLFCVQKKRKQKAEIFHGIDYIQL